AGARYSCRDFIELLAQLCADSRQRKNQNHRDQSGNQTIFDGRDTGLVPTQFSHQLHHLSFLLTKGLTRPSTFLKLPTTASKPRYPIIDIITAYIPQVKKENNLLYLLRIYENRYEIKENVSVIFTF